MENLKIKGTHYLKIVRKNGEIEEWNVDNMVVNGGLGLITARLQASSSAVANYMAVGSGTTAVGASQTTLATETTDGGLERGTGAVSQQTTTTANDTYQITKTWTASGTKTVEEIGVFNDATAGTMLSRVLTGSRTLYAGDTFTDTYKLVLVRA